MTNSIEEDLHKVRVANRLGAKSEHIADYTDLDKAFVESYLDREGLDYSDRIEYDVETDVDPYSGESRQADALRDSISAHAIDLVEEFYDKWKNLEEVQTAPEVSRTRYTSPRTSRVDREIAAVLAEEEYGEDPEDNEIDHRAKMSNHRFSERTEFDHIAKPSNEGLSEHDEDSRKTLRVSQKYASPGENGREIDRNAMKWYISNFDGQANEEELGEFIQNGLGRKSGVPVGRRVQKLLSEAEDVEVSGLADNGHRLYELQGEPELDEDFEALMEDSIELLKGSGSNRRGAKI